MLKSALSLLAASASIACSGNSNHTCVKVDGRNYTLSLSKAYFSIYQTEHFPRDESFVAKCEVGHQGILHSCHIADRGSRTVSEVRSYEAAVNGSKLVAVRARGKFPQCVLATIKFGANRGD